MYYDLHTHTVCSDGTLTPEALVSCAVEAGVEVLALTDHDTVEGLGAARAAATQAGINLVAGVEISAIWEGMTVHIVGLDIDDKNDVLLGNLARLQDIRRERIQDIAVLLARQGIDGALAVLAHAGSVGRTHVADWLVIHGHARSRTVAFKRFLTRGAPAYVGGRWPDMAEAVAWIRAAGGCSVLAHPTRYRLSGGRLRQLIAAFAESAGGALEVVSAGLDAGEIGRLAELALRYDLQGSVGSDFHGPVPWRTHPGGLVDLPVGCVPVWQRCSRMQRLVVS